MYKVDDEYGFLTKEVLEKDYVIDGLTDRQIASKYGIGSKATVWRRRRHYGIGNNTPNKSNQNAKVNRKFKLDVEDVIRWKSEGKTYEEMSSIAGCSRMVFYRRIKELSLVNECAEAMKKMRWHESLTDEQSQFLLGDLLGDGSITNWGMYQCNHSYKQKSFIQHKQDLFHNLLSPNFNLEERNVINQQNGKTYRSYYLRTMANEYLLKMHLAFYADNVKYFPFDYLQSVNFTPSSLASWYMGDGGRKANIPSLYTYGFGYWGNLQILMFLKSKFNIEGDLKEDCRESRAVVKRNFISIKKGEDSRRFFDIVRPHMISYFSYKLPS